MLCHNTLWQNHIWNNSKQSIKINISYQQHVLLGVLCAYDGKRQVLFPVCTLKSEHTDFFTNTSPRPPRFNDICATSIWFCWTGVPWLMLVIQFAKISNIQLQLVCIVTFSLFIFTSYFHLNHVFVIQSGCYKSDLTKSDIKSSFMSAFLGHVFIEYQQWLHYIILYYFTLLFHKITIVIVNFQIPKSFQGTIIIQPSWVTKSSAVLAIMYFTQWIPIPPEIFPPNSICNPKKKQQLWQSLWQFFFDK